MDPLRVVFLDIDGVLNNRASTVPVGGTIWRVVVDKACVARLQGLLDRTGASVVLSSAWRAPGRVAAVLSALARAGLSAAVSSRTPSMKDLGIGSRSDEIRAWLRTRFDPVSFAIFDDDDDAGLGPLTRWLVKTNPETGLQAEDVGKAEALLQMAPVDPWTLERLPEPGLSVG